ncbi:hypothetical protein [Anaeromicropila herbilytica]|uniref:Uncharacterized protein n=1 Tax=Anaeromicropila herbilytica TaxID=2785025 RepID=A0A7R7EMT8_9FIRM|nr:hypothetical protein [Anaeromicropila herbilytica]BCN31678.1 hypothetical protein bsdtb5_29730 [Anaeromicropila herbilytica]
MDKCNTILNCFDIKEYESSQLLKNNIKKLTDHKDAIKIIKQFELSHFDDYLRSCGTNNFTDFPYSKLSNTITEQSKYIIARNINNNINYFILDNFIDTFAFMQSIVNRGYFNNKMSTGKKIYGHFNSDNELLIGNKSIEIKKYILKEADITSIVRRKYYSFNNSHTYLQSQVAALGGYLGYGAKIACNDKNKVVYNISFNEIFTLAMPDLNISNIDSQYYYKKINFIDVIWANQKNNLITYAFEIELSDNLDAAFHRLSLYASKSNYVITKLIIITPYTNDYYRLQQICLTYDSSKIKHSFYHLTTQDFIETLKQRNLLVQPQKLELILLSKIISLSKENK